MAGKDDQVSGTALMSALSMPLAELQERVNLVERLAIASRHAVLTGAGASAASATTGAGSASSSQGAGAGKGAAAGGGTKTQATAAPKAETPPPATDPGDFSDTSATDFADGGDMLEGFTPEMSPAEARAAGAKIAAAVIAKRDNTEMAKAREIMQKYGTSKINEIKDDKIVEFYTDFKTAFPTYVAAAA